MCKLSINLRERDLFLDIDVENFVKMHSIIGNSVKYKIYKSMRKYMFLKQKCAL